MKNIVALISNNKNFLVYLFLASISLYLVFSSNFHHQNNFLNTASSAMGSFHKKSSFFTNYLDLKEKNEKLRIELALTKMSLEQSSYSTTDDFLVESDSISALQYVYRDAHIVSKTLGYNKNYFTLNKGSLNGIEVDDGVISTYKSLVGKVVKVSEHYSIVAPVINSDLALRVKILHNNVSGLLQWNGVNIEKAIVLEVGKRTPIEIGDTIVTSGFSAYLPEGMLVGTVDSFETDGDVLNIEINLSTPFNAIDDVFVVSNKLRKEFELLNSNQDLDSPE